VLLRGDTSWNEFAMNVAVLAQRDWAFVAKDRVCSVLGRGARHLTTPRCCSGSIRSTWLRCAAPKAPWERL